MIELQTVFENYLQTKNTNDSVPVEDTTPAMLAVRKNIPDFFNQCIQSIGYVSADWLVKGSVGQFNLNFSMVPWVAIFKESITHFATNGYYIVLLFSEDMSSAYLTLNQGYTAFEKQYRSKKLIHKKISDCSRAALWVIGSAPEGFTEGLIDLKTGGDLSGGYEVGSIWAKKYTPEALPSRESFEKDVHTLLRAYSLLAKKFPDSLIASDVAISNDEFNEAVEDELKRNAKTPPIPVLPPEPKSRPPEGIASGRETFVRSPGVAARGIAMADYRCVFATKDEPHFSFISKKTSRNYVEAHHLIPFSKQDEFEYSLDVEENIVALCPNCHRLLHHGRGGDKKKLLNFLWDQRKDVLELRGLKRELSTLREMYQTLSEND